RFGAHGRCTQAPYAACTSEVGVRAWPVCERNGVVHVWHHPAGAPPRFDVPVIPEWGQDGWSAGSHRRLEVATHSREIVENVVDVAHFMPVPQTDAQQFENEFDGRLAIQRSGGGGADTARYPGSTYRVEAIYHGPGFQLTELESRGVES